VEGDIRQYLYNKNNCTIPILEHLHLLPPTVGGKKE
jgi:hypothetical protein